MSLLFALIFLPVDLRAADPCPNLQGNYLACSSSLVGDSEAKEFLISQTGDRFTIDFVGQDGLLSKGKEFAADSSVVKSPSIVVQSSCEANALVQKEEIFLQGNPFLSFTAKYFLADENHLQLDIFMDAAAAAPTKSIRCIRFR